MNELRRERTPLYISDAKKCTRQIVRESLTEILASTYMAQKADIESKGFISKAEQALKSVVLEMLQFEGSYSYFRLKNPSSLRRETTRSKNIVNSQME